MQACVHRLVLANVTLQGRYNPPSYQQSRIDVFAYLVITQSQVILIDSGVGSNNTYIDHTFEPQRSTVQQQLARFNLHPRDVTMLVNSHLHFDHCGNNASFTNAEIYIQEKELEIARTTKYTPREWFDYPEARINCISGDVEITPGVRLLSTPGHTPGHQSVLVETDQSRILIAAQAAFTAQEFQRGGDPAEQAHARFEAQYQTSISRLKSLKADEVYFSHDIEISGHNNASP